MAYLKEIPRPRCACGKPATVELINYRNAPCGFFCRGCGKRAEREAIKRENEIFRRGLQGG